MEQQLLCTDDNLEDIVVKYSNMVYRLAISHMRNKSDADDVYQEVFFRYIRKNPIFESEEHRKAWLIRVTTNCCKKIYASAWTRRVVPLDESIVFESKEENRLFYDLQKLPMKYRAIIHLFYYEDMSINEICLALNKKPSAVKMQLMRARAKLKEILGEDCHV